MMEFLFAPQIAFSSLYGDMTQQKLDLLQLSACQVSILALFPPPDSRELSPTPFSSTLS